LIFFELLSAIPSNYFYSLTSTRLILVNRFPTFSY